MLRQITTPKCAPITLDQARKHLAVDASDRSNDTLIEMLIESATADSQMKTGRIWVESDWEWEPETVATNVFSKFPIVPVVLVKMYDMTEKEEESEPELPDEPDIPDNPDEPVDPDNPPIEDGGETGGENDKEDEGGAGSGDPISKRALAKARARKKREAADSGDADEEPPVADEPSEPAEPEWPEVSAEYLEIKYPSLDPMGYPAIGGITPLKPFPDKYRIVLTVGYGVVSHTEKLEQYDDPVLQLDKTGFTSNIIHLVFNRPVDGNIYVSNFEVRKLAKATVTPPTEPDNPPDVDPAEPVIPENPPSEGEDTGDGGDASGGESDTITRANIKRHLQSIYDRHSMRDVEEPGDSGGDITGPDLPIDPDEPVEDEEPKDEIIDLIDCYFLDGAVDLEYPEGAIQEGDEIQISFFEGSIYDEFNNFVQPIIQQNLPPVDFVAEDELQMPDEVPDGVIYESLTPPPIKNWILTRVGSLYSQRTEIALRAGKSNDAMFPDQFINNLLDPYRVRFFEDVR